ncbi:hypothetical protein GUJ93_ZPchr0001g31923 [Zizania palustris]|uniref:Uncharacterized protein n=1 Tax=Zizania palustris TaxID=103762 RepID=A0A8J5SEV7_ZIZPA|nr:hypothetical protein GUJ93_ZPchr0001g31923 [Zizania palustris]
MAAARKGTAMPLGAVFPPEATRRAVASVAEAVSDHRAELVRLRGFVFDNAALVSLVQRLPDEIMVLFGDGIFFPSRLIHTNELLVLLREGYYAERFSKQILQRRGWNWKLKLKRRKQLSQGIFDDLPLLKRSLVY